MAHEAQYDRTAMHNMPGRFHDAVDRLEKFLA